ncbi:hypothetical protein ACWGJL_29640, partial [Streptomyces sp. NPDC054808]
APPPRPPRPRYRAPPRGGGGGRRGGGGGPPAPRGGGAPPDADGITDWSKEHLGRHKYPRRVEFADELPLGPSMKVLKRELRARYTGR